MVTEDGDSRSSHVGDGGDHVVELLVPAGQPQHDLVVERDGNVFEGHQAESRGVDPFPQGSQVLEFPATVTGKLCRVHLDVVDTALLDVGQQGVGGELELSESDPDGKFVELRCGDHRGGP